ncbi:response regulator [Puia dinghuensis]|uniref:DNA-binding response regulator n=1 Tax=Puia dinghuensis TaxID=1792502 RepID=A0A8J2XRS6_9BACT|nr:response regulator transcription factor [Puia dinghuensis]GGA88171.1 DNA-binding response regulator [Puia dinghuensis]
MNILLVEDEPKVADFIRKGLKEQSYNVDMAYDGLFGEKLALENEYDLAILDVILPGINGLELCKRIRHFKPDMPILMLTALGATKDKVTGFESGADDYLVKPFHFEELLARVKALGRRKLLSPPGIIYRIADLEVDAYKKTARRAGKEIFLTAKEFSLLELLIVNKNRVLSRTFIAETVWGINYDRGTNLIDVYINYLRSKIDKGFTSALIHTVIGMGYVLKEEA